MHNELVSTRQLFPEHRQNRVASILSIKITYFIGQLDKADDARN